MKIIFLVVEKESSDAMKDGFKRTTIGTMTYITRLLKKQGHRAVCYIQKIDRVDYGYLDSFKPDIICLTPETDEKIIEWANNTSAKIGMGTETFLDINSAKDSMKKRDYVDFIALGGEPYNTWIEIAKNIESGKGFKDIKGIVYRDGTEIVANGDSNDFDINDFNDIEVILPESNEAAPIQTSLGCIGNCTFCSEKLMHPKWQGRKVEKVIEEIKQYTDKGHYHIWFTDSEIEAPDAKLEQLTKLCKGIIALNKPIYYHALFRPDFSRKANPDIMDLLVKSGLCSAFIGVESGSNEDLKLFNKRCTVQEAKDTIRLFEESGVYTCIGFMMFHPFSTLESISLNVDLLDDLDKADFSTIFTYFQSNKYDRLTMKTKEEGLYDENTNLWRFKDDKVSQIFSFIKFYFEIMRPTLDEYNKALAYQNWYRYLGKKFEKDIEIKEALGVYFKRTESIRQVMSINICIWFRKLLEIAKTDFNNEKAVSVSLTLLNKEMIAEMADYINREKKKMLSKVTYYIDREKERLKKILGISE